MTAADSVVFVEDAAAKESAATVEMVDAAVAVANGAETVVLGVDLYQLFGSAQELKH